MPDALADKSASPGAFRWLIGRYARRHAGVIALVAGLTLAGNLLAVVQPAILAGLLASFLDHNAAQPIPPSTSWLNLNYLGARVTTLFLGPNPNSRAAVALFGILFLVQSTLVAAATYASTYGAAWLRARYAKLIQHDLLSHLLHQDMAFFTRERSGELIARTTTDAGNTATALGPLILSVIQYTVQIVVFSSYLFRTSVWLTVGAMAMLAGQFGFTQALRKPIRRLSREETDANAELVGAVQEALTSVRVTKSFGAEPFEIEKLDRTLDRVSSVIMHKSRVDKLEAPVRSVLDNLAMLGIFLIASLQMTQNRLTLSGLMLFTYVGKQLITPINGAATTALWLEGIKAAYGRISELMAQQPAIVDGSVVKTRFERDLQLTAVSFGYKEPPASGAPAAARPIGSDGPVRRAVDQVTLEIRKGAFVALVGPSGAGKSTLADLVLRLYDPDTGAILMDGMDVRAYRQRDYRQLFGVVSQESLLFHDTVRNNIRFGRQTLTDADVERAARIANAHEFIVSLPQQYDTVVGDRGVRLSGGERQRVAIARAVVHRPQILILDEATSALDSESERLVQEAIDRVVSETTALVIAHRLSTVMHADRIVVLNHGEVEAIGSHRELVATNGTYQSFCRLQFGHPSSPEAMDREPRVAVRS